ncbi:MAG: hypothetical protein WEA24_05125 [Gemmatimonadota bacterium]
MNLLDAEVITVAGVDGTDRLSLPDLLARLLVGPEILGCPRLAAEQRSYWWRFLVRCAARALRTADLTVSQATHTDNVQLATVVREALLKHTERADWELFQPDPSSAGFLQPPTPGGVTPADDKYKRCTCALLTAVIGTKEHERKSEVGRVLDAESLVYALVEYQSGVIFGGRGNYESQLTGSRAGAGSGTPFMGATINNSMLDTFRHDVGVLLGNWERTARDLKGDVWALWAHRWDGEKPLPAAQLDPAFIPLARMVRVGAPTEGEFGTVWFRGSQGSRVADHTNGGHLGDPFTPLVPDPKGGHLKVRGTLAKGYDYKEVVRLLFPDTNEEAVPSPSVVAVLDAPPERELRVLFEGMAFEQGKTRGFHRRSVRLPRKAVQVGIGFRSEPIHAIHRIMLDRTADCKRALSSALAMLLTGEPRLRDDDRAKAQTALDRFEELVDRNYLDFLFRLAFDGESTGDTEPYRRWLFEQAVEEVLPEAFRSLPRNSGRRLEQEVIAEAYLRGRLRKDLDLPVADSRQEVTA